MTAFNVVRFRVKPEGEARFVEEHRSARPFAGLRRGSLVKTGERSYCFIGEWDDYDSIVRAREGMIAILDRFRDTLEEQPGLGVTDPVSGEEVVAIKP